MVFVIDVETVDFNISKWAKPGIETGAGAEKVPECGGEGGGLRIGRECGSGERAAKTEEDLFAGGLALGDLGGEGGAGHEAGGAVGGHGGGLSAAGGAEVQSGEAAGAEEGCEEGEDDDVDGGVGAELGEGDLGCGT